MPTSHLQFFQWELYILYILGGKMTWENSVEVTELVHLQSPIYVNLLVRRLYLEGEAGVIQCSSLSSIKNT